jgi:hypothetical protein
MSQGLRGVREVKFASTLSSKVRAVCSSAARNGSVRGAVIDDRPYRDPERSSVNATRTNPALATAQLSPGFSIFSIT